MGYFAMCIGPTIEDRIKNAVWNLKLFADVDYDPSYSYLIGMAMADLKQAEELARELKNDEPQDILHQ